MSKVNLIKYGITVDGELLTMTEDADVSPHMCYTLILCKHPTTPWLVPEMETALTACVSEPTGHYETPHHFGFKRLDMKVVEVIISYEVLDE